MPTPLAELVAPIKKGSLGGAQVADVGKICDSELKASDDDPSEGDNNGTETDHSKFVYHRDRVVDKYSVTRDTINEGTAATLSYNNSDQKSTSPNLYVETNAKAEADVVLLPTQAVSNSNEDEGDYAYLEPSVNYDSDGKEKCSRTTNNLFKPSELVELHSKESTTLDSPFKATRAKGEYQSETILNANNYKTGPSPNGMTVELNDGFCFIASIDNAAEYGTLLLNFKQSHPAKRAITSYMINNHIQDPDKLLTNPRTFKGVNDAGTTEGGYFSEHSIDFRSMLTSQLSPVSLYSAPMWVYNKSIESRVVSYPHGHASLQGNDDLQAYIGYIQSYSKNNGDKSADLNVFYSSSFISEDFGNLSVAAPFTDGKAIRTVVPYGTNVASACALGMGNLCTNANARSDRTNEHRTTAYGSIDYTLTLPPNYIEEEVTIELNESGLHAGFPNSAGSTTGDPDQVLWNANSNNGVTSQFKGNRKDPVNGRPTVSNVIRADLGWRPYEIIVFRGTLTYNKNTGVESHSEDYVEYFRFRTFDTVFKKETYNRQIGSASESAESTATSAEGGDVHEYSFPVTGYHRESDGGFVINFSENFKTSDFSPQNKLKVAVIQDIVVDPDAVKATFSSAVINAILPDEGRVFSPIFEDTLQVLNKDEGLFFDTSRDSAKYSRPFGYGNSYSTVEDPNSPTGLTYLTHFFCLSYEVDLEDAYYGNNACFNSNSFIRAGTGGPSAFEGTVATEWEHPNYDCTNFGDLAIDFPGLPWVINSYENPVQIQDPITSVKYPTDPTQRSCSIPIFPGQDITQMDPDGNNVTQTAAEWGYAFSGGLAVRRDTSPDVPFEYINDTVFSDPVCVAGYVNGYRETSWFARDLVAAYSETRFNQIKDADYGIFSEEHNGVNFIMPVPWTLGIQLIKPENINGIDLDSVRCSLDRDSFHSKALGPEEGESDTLNGVGYHCGECEDLAEPPSAEFDDDPPTKHGKVKKGFPLTDTLNDHRSYVRIHDGANLNP